LQNRFTESANYDGGKNILSAGIICAFGICRETILQIVSTEQAQNGLQSRFTVKRPGLKQTQIVF